MKRLEGPQYEQMEKDIRAIYNVVNRKHRLSTCAEICEALSDRLDRPISESWFHYRAGVIRENPKHWGFDLIPVPGGLPNQDIGEGRWMAVDVDHQGRPRFGERQQAILVHAGAWHMGANATRLRRLANNVELWIPYWPSRNDRKYLEKIERGVKFYSREVHDIVDDFRRMNNG